MKAVIRIEKKEVENLSDINPKLNKTLERGVLYEILITSTKESQLVVKYEGELSGYPEFLGIIRHKGDSLPFDWFPYEPEIKEVEIVREVKVNKEVFVMDKGVVSEVFALKMLAVSNGEKIKDL